MTSPWTTLDAVLAAVAAGMSTTPANLLATDTQSVEKAQEALNTSTADLYQILIQKGYSPYQISQWDNGATYNLDLAIYWFGIRTGLLSNYDDTRLEALDRREYMKDKDWALIINGVAVAPQINASVVGGASSGQLTAVTRMLRGNCGRCGLWPCRCRGGW